MLRDSGDFRQALARTTPSCNRTTCRMSRAAICSSAALLLCCATTYAQPTLREDHTTRDLRTSPIPAAGEKIPVRDVDALPAWLWRQPGMPSTMLSSPQGIALLADQGTSYAQQVFATCDLRTRPVTRMAYSMRAEALALAGDFTAAIQALDELVQKADSFDRESAISQLITREALVYHTLIAADESTRRAQFTTSLTAALTTWLNSKERSAIASGLKRENENNDLNMTKPEQLGWYLENARTWSPLSLKSLAEVNVDWSVDFVCPDMSPREARQLLAIARTQQLLLPLRSEIIQAGQQAHTSINSTGIRPACWDDRMVALGVSEIKAPVIVAVWDTGVDPAIFPGQIYENPGEAGEKSSNNLDDDNDGYIDNLHGLSFEHQGHSPKPIIDMDAYCRFYAKETGRTRFPAGMQRMLQSIRGHGTCGASLIATGNPAVRLYNLRSTFFNAGGMAGVVEDAWIPTIESVITHLRDDGVRIVNMSWGGASEELEDALERGIAASPNVLFVVSAGNSGRDTGEDRRVLGDKTYDNVVLVGALDPQCEPTDFTSYGDFVNLFAWGRRVPATTIGGLPDFFGGTSAAAPIVSGLAAKLLALDPSLTPTQLKQIMMDTGTELPGHPGCKILHMKAAVDAIRAKR